VHRCEKKNNRGGKVKSFTVLLVIIAVLSGCAFGTISRFSEKYTEGKTNVIANSSFEKKESYFSDQPEGWVVSNEMENSIVWEVEADDQQDKCIKIRNSFEKTYLISDEFSLNSQSVYYTKCQIKSEKPTSKSVILHLLAFDKNGKVVNEYSEEAVLNSDWNLVELTSGFFNQNAVTGRVSLSIPEDDDNAFWIDDVESYNVHKFAYRYQTD